MTNHTPWACVPCVVQALDEVAAATAAVRAAAAALGGDVGSTGRARGQGPVAANADGSEDRAGTDGGVATRQRERSRLTSAQQQLVVANREDLARRQAAAEAAAAEAAARGRSPAGAGWATFAAVSASSLAWSSDRCCTCAQIVPGKICMPCRGCYRFATCCHVPYGT